MPQRDIGRAYRQRAIQFVVVVRRHAQPQPRLANGVQVCDIQILLTQMHAVGAVLNCQLPVIVDKQTGMVTLAERNRLDNRRLYRLLLPIFNTQLDSAHADLQQSRNPLHAVDDRIEP